MERRDLKADVGRLEPNFGEGPSPKRPDGGISVPPYDEMAGNPEYSFDGAAFASGIVIAATRVLSALPARQTDDQQGFAEAEYHLSRLSFADTILGRVPLCQGRSRLRLRSWLIVLMSLRVFLGELFMVNRVAGTVNHHLTWAGEFSTGIDKFCGKEGTRLIPFLLAGTSLAPLCTGRYARDGALVWRRAIPCSAAPIGMRGIGAGKTCGGYLSQAHSYAGRRGGNATGIQAALPIGLAPIGVEPQRAGPL